MRTDAKVYMCNVYWGCNEGDIRSALLMHHLASAYDGCHFVRKGTNPDGQKLCTAFLRFRHAGAALAVIQAWNGLYIPSIGPKPLGVEMAQDNLIGARQKARPPQPPAPPPIPPWLAGPFPPTVAAPFPPTVAAPPPPTVAASPPPTVAASPPPSVAVPIMAAPPRPSVAAPSVADSLAPRVAIPSAAAPPLPTASPSAVADKYQLDPANRQRFFGIVAGYITPKSKGLLPLNMVSSIFHFFIFNLSSNLL